MRNMQSAPTMNDPNASVTLLMTPPIDGNSNCAEWVYHYTLPAKPAIGQAVKKNWKLENGNSKIESGQSIS